MGTFGPIISAIAPILGTLLGGSAPQAPQASPAPAAPAAVAPPPAPEVSTAKDVKANAPVIDAEAARVRAQKRRRASEDRRLFSLSTDESDSVTLTKSLLGGN